MDGIRIIVLPRDTVSDSQLQACAALFSSHYGVWGRAADAELVGRRVRLSADRLRRDLLFGDGCGLAAAYSGEDLLGHVFYARFHYERAHGASSPSQHAAPNLPLPGTVLWLTQLVVHTSHRHRGIATALIRSVFDRNVDVAAGLVTSHPHAVRAFERATGLLVVPATLFYADVRGLLDASEIPYLRGCPFRVVPGRSCTVSTGFLVDHGETEAALANESAWHLGKLRDGDEFLAVAFTVLESRQRP